MRVSSTEHNGRKALLVQLEEVDIVKMRGLNSVVDLLRDRIRNGPRPQDKVFITRLDICYGGGRRSIGIEFTAVMKREDEWAATGRVRALFGPAGLLEE